MGYNFSPMSTSTPSTPGIILLGLGPGELDLLTRQAWRVLESSAEIYLRTRQHPAVAGFPPGLQVHSFDDLFEHEEQLPTTVSQIVERVLAMGRRPQGVVYAMPGHPLLSDAAGPEIARRAREEGLPVQVVPGISILEPALAALGVGASPQISLVDALGIAGAHVPPFPPGSPALIFHIQSSAIAAWVKDALLALYPKEHSVTLVRASGSPQEQVERLPLEAIDRSASFGPLTALYVPPLDRASSFEAFLEVIAHLRAPEGCPWDREQTHQSLRSSLLEETYEALAALDAGDVAGMQEEFGDLLLIILMQAQIASEAGEFNMAGVLRGIHNKIVRRHPHVFGDAEVKNAEVVLQNWERLKAVERAEKKDGNGEEPGLLESVSPALPALAQAELIQKRAARVGFDWSDVQGVLDKMAEEIEEVRTAPDSEARAAEVGDLLFAVANLARWYKVDPESALREANLRFRQRFSHIEASARRQGRPLTDLSLDEMEALWQEAKKL